MNEPRPLTIKPCPHGSSPKTCPTCYSKRPPEPASVAPRPRTRVVHFLCGCRMSVSAENEAGNWSECGDEEAHEGMPRVAGFFYEAAKRAQTVTEEHSLAEREGCADERCAKAWAALERARSKGKELGRLT